MNLKSGKNLINHKGILIKIGVFIFLSFIGLHFYLNIGYGGYLLIDRCKDQSFKLKNIRTYKGVLLLNDSVKIRTAFRNTKPVLMLYEFIKEGDSIKLNKESDTLFVYRNSKKYWFIYYGQRCDGSELDWNNGLN